MHEKQKTLFISISSGIILRNICAVPHGVLEQAQKHFEKIVLIVPLSARDQVEKDFGSDSVLIRAVPLPPEAKNLFQKAVYFFTKHLLYTETTKIFTLEHRPDLPDEPWIIKRIRLGFKFFLGRILGSSTFVRKKIAPFLDRLAYRDRSYKEVFDEFKPNIVFLPNIQHWQDTCLLRESRRNGITTVGMPGSWDHLPKWYRAMHPDRLLVNHYVQKGEAIKLQSYDPNDVQVVGVPYYDLFTQDELLVSREEFCKSVGLDPHRKIMLFVSEGIYTPDDGDVVGAIVSGMENVLKGTQLIIRPYPGYKYEDKKFSQFEQTPDVYINWIKPITAFDDPWYPRRDELVFFFNLMTHADVVVTTYSSVSIEASWFGTPVIGINFDGKKQRPYYESIRRYARTEHLKHIFETGAVLTVDSEDELCTHIARTLEKKNPFLNTSVLKHKMCGPLDGKSAERIVDEIVASSAEVSV